MTNHLLQSAFELAACGLKVMPVHSVDPTGRCSCGCRKASCRSRGKHPRIFKWQEAASDDEETIGRWWEKWPMSNVGIQWGPRSNAIDIEFDSEEGRASADKYLAGVITPSYQSSRSVHRIFRYVDALAGFGATTSGQRVEHLEYRIGADAKGAQSVAPPSRHFSGKLYGWLKGLSISEVDIAPPPPALVELILRSAENTQNNAGKASKTAPVLSEKIQRGQRNTSLVSLAGTLRRRGLVKEEIIPSLQAVADRRCEHVPGDEVDVTKIAESVCRYEPTDPILAKTERLVLSARETAAARLHPAIRRARRHAIEHRLKRRRLA